jgi:hypothetical protein
MVGRRRVGGVLGGSPSPAPGPRLAKCVEGAVSNLPRADVGNEDARMAATAGDVQFGFGTRGEAAAKNLRKSYRGRVQ